MKAFVCFAPGRVELLGNHTDYNQGLVLSAAIGLGVKAEGRLREDGEVVFVSEGFEGSRWFARADNVSPAGDWTDYPTGVVAQLREAGVSFDSGFEIRYKSDLPVGAGLSSSAAMEVATAVALANLFGLDLSPMEIARLCRRAENEFVGVQCGLLDQASSVFGKAGHLIRLDCRSEQVDWLPFPEGLRLLITNSGVPHALTGGEYNERRSQCFEAARLLGVSALRDVSIAQLREASLPDVVKRRAAHVVGEGERVREAAESLLAGDGSRFGRLMSQSHESSRVNFENSTPELDALVEIALHTPGVLGSRLSGGGFGGATVSVVQELEAVDAAAYIEAAYLERTGNRATTILCEPANGAMSYLPQ